MVTQQGVLNLRSYLPRKTLVNPTEWMVGNFKSLEYAALPLHRLMVLTGANSSGKSSLIQSLLLLAQSSDNEVILNGVLVRLGGAGDVIRAGSSRVTIAYSICTKNPDETDEHEWSFSLELGPVNSTLEVLEFDVAVDGNQVLSATSSRVTAKAKQEVNPNRQYGNNTLRVREIFGRAAPARTYLTFSGFYPDVLLTRNKKDRVLAALRRNYSKSAMEAEPERLFQLYEELQPWWRSHQESLPDDVVDLYGEIFKQGSSPIRFLDNADQKTLDKLFILYAEAAEEEGWRYVPVPSHIMPPYASGYYNRTGFGLTEEFKEALHGLTAAIVGLRKIRDSVRYLGPLREEPQVVSPSGGRNRSLPAGTKGEYTADLLAWKKDSDTVFYDWNNKRNRMKLSDAVSLWTTYLGVGDGVEVKDQGKLGRGLRLNVHGVERDLTTVGVGASQLLPVIAVVLSADRDSSVCIEQPELHLHPAVQSRLADFFMCARPDISLIIETHSEYIITRIRLRAAKEDISVNDVSVFFAEQENGVTNLRNLHLNSDGGFIDWPKGFFDTQDEDSRALVRAIASGDRNRLF